ncbi:MAG: glycoside hydrolase family 43 protein [Acidimicrobiales bacterium]
MTLTEQTEAPAASTDDPAGGSAQSTTVVAAMAAVLVGILAGALYRQGTFYPAEAFGMAVLCGIAAAVILVGHRDRYGLVVTGALGGLTGWWLARSFTEHSPAAFLPLGASFLAFLAAYLVVRCLSSRDRTRLAMSIVAVGTVLAGSAVFGVLGRSTALSQDTDGVWRASTTLTYPAATAVVCAVCLLLAMAFGQRSPLARLAISASFAGLLAAQSHWELLALGAGALLVPRDRWPGTLAPLTCGAVAGLTVAASSRGPSAGLLPWVVVLVSLAASAVPVPLPGSPAVRRAATLAWLCVAVGSCVAALHLHPGVAHPVAGQSQTDAWTASVDAWRSSALTGTGPPRTYTTTGPVGSYPGFVPDTVLTLAADGGLVAALLFLGTGAAVAASIRRRDLLTSCGAAAAVAFAVGGVVDFAWQLPAVALLGGCAAGLAAVPLPRATVGRPVPDRSDSRFLPLGAASVWSLVAIAVVAVQFTVGSTHTAGGSTRLAVTEPPHSTDPAVPGRVILTGPDPTDPFMLKIGGRYYLYTSEGTTFMNVPLRTGPRPGRWSAPIDVLPVLPAWATGGLTWAPDVQRVSGGWALYFTSLVKGIVPETHCIGSAFARSPSGPFIPTAVPIVCQLDHRGSIDARAFVAPGNQLVLLWKSEDNANPSVPGPDQDGPTGIYAQPLSPDGRRLLGQPVKILGPSESWEGTIVEAPDMVEAWGTYWLFFSGNWYSSPSYGIGVAACQSPFGPCTDPDPAPLIGSNLQGSGPGEESLFTDGDSTYILYNPFHANDPGPVIPRPVVMARLGFTPRGPYLAEG